jgi:hypothetical protein
VLLRPHGDWPRLRGLFLSYINADKFNGRLSAWMAAFLFAQRARLVLEPELRQWPETAVRSRDQRQLDD